MPTWGRPDPADWWRRSRATARPVLYRRYDPAADAHAAPGVRCLGDRGPVRASEAAVGGGTAAAKTADWTLCPAQGDEGEMARPKEGAIIADGADEWVVGDVVGFNPAGPWDCPNCLKIIRATTLG